MAAEGGIKMPITGADTLHRRLNRASEVVGSLLVDAFHHLALFAIGGAIVWSAVYAFAGMAAKGHASIDDILLLFIYLELGAMVGIYFKTNHMPVRYLIYVAMTALTRMLISDIQAPDLETRIAILKKKAEFWAIRLPDDVAEFLATIMKNNIRELEGGLVKLGAVSSLTNTEITQEMAKNELKYLIDSRDKIITSDLVQKVVAESFGVKISDLKSKRRTKTVVLPRQVAMYLCRTLVGSSLPETGQFFGGRDHSTVIHSCRVIDEKKEKDPELRAKIDMLIKQLTS